MAAVVEPRVSREKLEELLSLGAEHASLDFKETCNLNATSDRVELAKDIGAMQFDGGFIVIGADSSGVLTGRLTAAEAGAFDEANLRNILGKWIDPALDLLVGIHEVDGKWAIVIYVGPSPAGASVYTVDGQYQDAGGKPKTVFRQGDVFVRDGSKATRWQQADVTRFRARIREVEKEKWRQEFTADIEAVIRSASAATSIAAGPASALTWQLDEATFEQSVVEQLRHGDDIPLKLLLDSASATATELILAGDSEELGTLLDRLACLLALAVRLELPQWIERVAGVLGSIYDFTVDESTAQQRSVGGVEAARVELAIIERIMALGALAVRRSDCSTLRTLVIQQVATFPEIYTNWIRHASVAAARAGYLDEVDDQGAQVGSGAAVSGHGPDR